MTLKTRASGEKVWELRFYETNSQGVRERRAVTIGTLNKYPTESAARCAPEALATMLRANAESNSVTAPVPTVGAVIARFEREEMPERYSTRAAYRSMLKTHIKPRWEGIPLDEVRPMAVEDWLKGLKLAAKTKTHIRGLMQVLFRCAQRWELSEKNPIQLVRVKGGTKRLEKPAIITTDQFQRILSHLKEPYRMMVLLAGCLGLRVSEIMALKWEDFDFQSSTLLVQRSIVHGRVDMVKTEYSYDRIPVDEMLKDKLLEFRATHIQSADGWLFANPVTGRPFHQEEIQKKRLRKAGEAAGVGQGIGWHTFRHSYRSWLDDTGAPMGVQRELMRHASITTTMNVYGAAVTQTKRDAHAKVVQMLLKDKPDSAQAAAQKAS